MPSRAIALLLAFVLFWSGFATDEQAVSIAVMNAEQLEARSAGDPANRLHDGTIEDHDRDSLHAQAHAESVTELPGLFLAPAEAPAPELAMAPPRPYTAPARSAPYLDGPQRPPCATALVA
jgi:hypothetical protein